jgi:DNA invertase Pin-like site-specific DNA recombinase
MKPRALLYARVSTTDKGQDWAAQLEELRKVAAQRGWQIVGEEHDTTSGTKALRPGLFNALNLCRAGGVDILAATATDRVARSTKNLVDLVDELEALGVKLACTREGAVDATTPQGRAFMQVRAVFAELERNLTAERIREGRAVRRARGVKLGRRRTLNYQMLPSAILMRKGKQPKSWSEIAAALGGSPGAWSRAVKRAPDPFSPRAP